MDTITLEKGLATFLDGLAGKNRSGATVRAYQTDILQFIAFLHANNVSIHTPWFGVQFDWTPDWV